MLRFILVVCLTAFVSVTSQVGAHQMEDVVHLKNGSIVRGTIIEQILGESLKIQTQGGSVFVYTMDEIVKISREPVRWMGGAATGVEIGMLFGLSHLSSDDDGVTLIGVPTAGLSGFGSIPSLYISWFPGKKLSIGPEFSFGQTASGGFSLTGLYFGGRGAFFLQSNAMSDPYILGHSALRVIGSRGDYETDFSAGAGLGYQWRLGPAFVLRMEGRYRRWFDDEINEISFILGFGTRLGGR